METEILIDAFGILFGVQLGRYNATIMRIRHLHVRHLVFLDIRNCEIIINFDLWLRIRIGYVIFAGCLFRFRAGNIAVLWFCILEF